MTNTIKKQESLTTIDKKFYVGMTAEEAKKKDLYKSVFLTDFTDIDQNHNGILEDWEICNRRDSECKLSKWGGGLLAVGGALTAGLATIAEPFTLGGSTPAVVAGASTFTGGMYLCVNGAKEQEITDKYKKEHGLE